MSSAIPDDEILARFVFTKRHVSGGVRLKPEALIPYPHKGTSVSCHQGRPSQEIWKNGIDVAKARQLPLIGRGDLRAGDAYGCGLDVVPDPVRNDPVVPDNPYHAEIIGWGAEKAAQKNLAIRLSGCVTYHPYSPEHSLVFSLDFDGTAVITDDGREVSYAEFRRMTEEFAANVPPRSLVFLLVGNDLESLVSYVACLNHGIVPLLLGANIDPVLLEVLKQKYAPDFVFKNGQLVDDSRGRDALAAPARRLFPELALLLTTSGSTGSPKLVRQSYGNIRANTASIVEYLNLDASERPITTLPMNYTYGLSIINTHLSVGATLLLTDKTLMQREFWSFFNAHQATSFGGVPYTYEMLDRLMFFRRKLPSLKTMTQAGGKILPELHRKFAEYAEREGKRFVVMYGQCEATARMSYLPPERSLEKVGSMGVAIPGGRFEIVDGELVYYGDNVTLGYAECAADLAKGDERGGRLQTGDMARVDEDGFYYIIGRKKRFLKIFGNRVNLDETERLIKGRFDVVDCACGGQDDHMKIYVAGAAALQEIRDFVAETTHLNFSAFEVVGIDAIPKNDSGKTLYSELP